MVPDVVARHMADGAVLVHLGTNRIFELNSTGSRIWALIVEGATASGIADILAREFDIDADAAAREVRALTERLAQEGLLQP
jgi:hypothetical protein